MIINFTKEQALTNRMWFSVVSALLSTTIQATSSPGVPFVMRWKSGPLAKSNDIRVLNGFVNTIDWDQNQSDLSDLTLGMRRVTARTSGVGPGQRSRSPSSNQKDRGLWERDCDTRHHSGQNVVDSRGAENVFSQSASWKRHCVTHWREQRCQDFCRQLQIS